MRWVGHVARMGEGRGVNGVLVAKPEGKNHWGDLDVDGRIILGSSESGRGWRLDGVGSG